MCAVIGRCVIAKLEEDVIAGEERAPQVLIYGLAVCKRVIVSFLSTVQVHEVVINFYRRRGGKSRRKLLVGGHEVLVLSFFFLMNWLCVYV